MTSRISLPTPRDAATLDELFRCRVAASPEAVAYRFFDRDSGGWRALSWAQMAAGVARWQSALAAEGLQPGDRIAIALRNGPEWILLDQAALAQGLVVVPLYPEDRPDNMAWSLADSGATLLLLHDHGRWRRICAALEELPALRRVVIAGTQGPSLDGRLVTLAKWLPAAGHAPPSHTNAPEALATLVYTSGTMGRPKGVMLSHHNILSVTRSALAAVPIGADDRFLSFLPLSHMYERTVGYYLPMMAGAEVAFARSIDQLGDDMTTVQPTLLVTVPRLLERIHTRIEAKLARSNGVARGLFRLAVHCGWHHFEWQQGRARWSPLLLLQPLLRRLVGRKMVQRLGGRMRLLVSGGAPLPLAIARTFIGLGVPLLQGYGLSETSPQVCVNRPEDNDPRGVGRVLEGTEVAIGAENELLVRGPGVMLGYWNNPAATAAAIDPQGWFHSGDQGQIIDGRVQITGRLKDILVLSNGEKVPPTEMESAIAREPLFEQVLVVGEGRPHLAALVVLNSEQWPLCAQQCGVDPQLAASLAEPAVVRQVLHRIGERLHHFPGYAKVRRVHLTLEPWTLENGLMTATMKLRRNVIVERFAGEVAALYR